MFGTKVKHLSVMITLLVVFTLVLAACGGGDDAPAEEPEPTATEVPAAPAEDPTPEPEEEAAEEEPTPEPVEEAAEEEATEEPVEEAAEEPEEEATAEPEEEATAEPEEEATAEPEEEATAEPEEEATAEPEEEATAEPEEEDDTTLSPEEEAGAYIVTMAGGCGCHFNRDLGTLAGGFGFMDDAVFSRNLTPHETGIAGKSDEELTSLIRMGHYEDRVLVVMPNFYMMSDEDVANVIAYLRSLEPAENEIPDRNIDFEPVAKEFPDPPAVAPEDGPERGAYVAGIVNCARCHTPTDDDGNPVEGMHLAGAPYRDTVAPNLTSDEETGIGSWAEEELVDFLSTGEYSDGTEAHSAMKGVAEEITSQLTEDDRQALAEYLLSLPPVSNEPEPTE